MSEQIKCIGCGVPIQTEDKEGLGYAPPSSLKKEAVICQRCFRLKHYNEIQDVNLTDDDYRKILSSIGDTQSLVVKIVDIFDFNGSWLPGIHRYIGKNKLMLVGNKVDLLPKSVNKNRLKQWMATMAKEYGVKAEEVHLVSSAKGTGLQEVAEQIDELREGKDVYVVGCTNVGKSTFINGLIKQLGTEQQDIITTSYFPGTTLNLIDIPLDEETALFDTPGIINHHQMAHFVSKDELKIIMPKKEIKPLVYQLNEEQSLFLGGLARFDYIKGGRRSFVCHISNDLNIHRTKLERADDLYEKHLGELLTPPQDREKLPPLKRYEFMIKEKDTDIVFSGLGWISVKEAGAKVAAYAPEGVAVTLRPSLI
ncbi:GTPase YqeH [Fictibacillus macauensis ZFHKF-1]|uniref:GTPase YqeH n=1 Tax=Fictibacillus macauensis ZFHKF-1 TaxID=1196324 RepID=I8UEK2_9BACL|nr:ribosome biogenesis GTPase YqeH [Fictibacillus macauensis]EIT85248.1 GTPase YqeH [Fictibacillus macauensis ZFHKF-1]